MNLQWVFLSGFAAAVFNVLAIFGTAQYRIPMRIGAVISALAFAGFLAGPPVDQFAGAIVMIALILGGAYLWLRH
ncbi:MAG: hypothetical protein U1A24_07760 [Cypionkella sp.]|uniref:hypothetical protein n=1 Tax=Cypionkella sp. TaxID=2811411 RepID=UPI002ABC8A21|nr:hypothetical protein [Cypionkella sp.]MDZ4310438.1 hypothetical protein [Cypionkella sp.]